MKRIFTILICLGIVSACNKEEFFAGPYFYQDSFETYSQVSDLIVEDDEKWSFTQLTRDENKITLDTSRFHTGQKSLKFQAKRTSNGNASKCSLAKQNMAYWADETVRVTAWYYIEGNDTLEWLFLMDLEEQTAIGAGPGMRLALVNNSLRIEYKFLEDDITQTIGEEIPFQRNQWVELVWEVKLSQDKNGYAQLWQDGQLVINSHGIRTLPKDLLYFQQGTKGMYSSIEVGITANSEDSDLIIWVDDVKFEKIE